MQAFADAAPTVSLIFFFTIFAVIFIWAVRPSNKKRLESYGQIPLKEETHD